MTDGFWAGDSVTTLHRLSMAEQQMRCTACGHTDSIDAFDCLGVDLEFPECGIAADDSNVFCPSCFSDVVGVVVFEG